MADARLAEVIERLERAAAALRAPDLPAERAAHLVDECARLASEGAAQLDRELRAADAPSAPAPAPGQLTIG